LAFLTTVMEDGEVIREWIDDLRSDTPRMTAQGAADALETITDRIDGLVEISTGGDAEHDRTLKALLAEAHIRTRQMIEALREGPSTHIAPTAVAERLEYALEIWQLLASRLVVVGGPEGDAS
jgi:hypothetical protein